MKKEAVQDKEHKRSGRSRALTERFGKSYSQAVQCSAKTKVFVKPEKLKNAINSEQKGK